SPDPVGKPAIKKRLVRRTALGQADVTLALQRLDGFQDDAFPVRAALFQELLQSADGLRADFAVDLYIGKVLTIAVQSIERALQKAGGYRGPHIHAGVEQFCGQAWRMKRDFIKTGAQPVGAPIYGDSFVIGELLHGTGIAMAARHGFGDAPSGRSAAISRVIGIITLHRDYILYHSVYVHRYNPFL